MNNKKMMTFSHEIKEQKICEPIKKMAAEVTVFLIGEIHKVKKLSIQATVLDFKEMDMF